MAHTLEDYTIGWISALPIEAAVAKAMLDRTHPRLPTPAQDDNIYDFGEIDLKDENGVILGTHFVVVARLPFGLAGKSSAATVARDMKRTFPALRFGLMVGIAGGVWSPDNDIRLGDVVVGVHQDGEPGVVQYDHGKTIQSQEFAQKGTPNKPPMILLNAVAAVQANHLMMEYGYLANLEITKIKRIAERPTFDELYQPTYIHQQGTSCADCDKGQLRTRNDRLDSNPKIHYGAIASGDQVMRDAVVAEKIRQRHNILCFEMEAAGLDAFPCLVIRGISDYADTHKNDNWHAYAAAAAAAFAKEVLTVIAPAAVVNLPVVGNKYWLIPRRSNPIFTGRETLLKRMTTYLLPPPELDSSLQVFVLYGIGGAGKSETAIKFAEENRESFWGIFWIDGDSAAKVHQAFANVARMCGLKDESLENVLQWLAFLRERWLLIIDNCDDHRLDFEDFIPKTQHGSIIITTRLRECQNLGPLILETLDELELEESILLLLKACRIDNSQRDVQRIHAKDVVNLLGQLPLALVHAGAYVGNKYCTLAQYPQVFVNQQRKLMAYEPSQRKSRYQSVYATFEISIEYLQTINDNQSQLAVKMLQIMAFLHHEDVREDIFTKASKRLRTVEGDRLHYQDGIHLSGLLAGTSNLDNHACSSSRNGSTSLNEGNGSDGASDDSTSDDDVENLESLHTWHYLSAHDSGLISDDSEESFRNARALLFQLSLVRINSSEGAISMHPLVHEWARIRMSLKDQELAWERTACILVLAFAFEYEQLHFIIQMQPHTETCLWLWPHFTSSSKIPLNIGRILFHFWSALRTKNSAAYEILRLFSERLTLHPESVSAQRQDLAFMGAEYLQGAGEYAAAARVLEQVVESRQQESPFGPGPLFGHFALFQAQSSLSRCYLLSGDVPRGTLLIEEVHQAASAIWDTSTHNHFSGIWHYLAMAYDFNDDAQKAIPLLEKALQQYEREGLPLQHPDIMLSKRSLAKTYMAVGETQKAILLFEQIAEARSLLPEDSACLIAKQDLARAYKQSGHSQDSVPLLEEVVEARRLLGPEHPELLASQHELAMAYSDSNNGDRATVVFREIVEVKQKMLPPDDDDFLHSKNHLAMMYAENGESKKAATLFEEIFEMRRRTLEPDNEVLLYSIEHLVQTYITLDENEKAIPLLEGLLRTQREKLPLSDENRLRSTERLISLYLKVDARLEAVPLLEEIVGYERLSLEFNDKHRLNHMFNLSKAYSMLLEHHKSVPLWEELIDVAEIESVDNDQSLAVSYDQNLVISYFFLAHAYVATNETEKSVPLAEKIVKRSRTFQEPEELMISFRYLIHACYASDRFQEAAILLEEVVQSEKKNRNPDDTELLGLVGLLARSYLRSRNLQKAVPSVEVLAQSELSKLQHSPDEVDWKSVVIYIQICMAAGEYFRAAPILYSSDDARKNLIGNTPEDDAVEGLFHDATEEICRYFGEGKRSVYEDTIPEALGFSLVSDCNPDPESNSNITRSKRRCTRSPSLSRPTPSIEQAAGPSTLPGYLRSTTASRARRDSAQKGLGTTLDVQTQALPARPRRNMQRVPRASESSTSSGTKSKGKRRADNDLPKRER